MSNTRSSVRISGSTSFSVSFRTTENTELGRVRTSENNRDISQSNSTPSSRGLSAEKIRSLPVRRMKSEQMQRKLNCSVCLDEFQPDDELKELPCKHKFHPRCIGNWLKNHNSCPLCRQPIAVAERRASAPSNSNRARQHRDERRSATMHHTQFTFTVRASSSSLSASSSAASTSSTTVTRSFSSSSGRQSNRMHARVSTVESRSQEHRMTRSVSRQNQHDHQRVE